MSTSIQRDTKVGLGSSRTSFHAKLTVPNFLSACRIISVPFLLLLAWFGQTWLYMIGLTIAFLTDLFDGMAARILNQRSELGAKLDMCGDVALFLSIPFGFCWLWPEIFWRQWWYAGPAIGCYAISAAVALAKFRQLPNYHTWLGKTSNMVLSAGVLLAILGGGDWLLRAGLLLMTTAILEEIAISLTLTKARANVASWWHVSKAKAARQ